MPMQILLSNDDGVHADGLKVMYKRLSKLGKVTVVAPLEEKSTTGHALTLHKPLRLIKMDEKNFYGVSGSPADCVFLGIRQVLKRKPDLVVSGINRGANLGQDVYYSGTVSAAREACILGIPAWAVSLVVDFKKRKPEHKLNYDAAARTAVDLIKKMKDIELPLHTLMNLNVPDRPYARIKGTEIPKQGFQRYSGSVIRRRDHRGKDYYWVGGQYQGFRKEAGTDSYEVNQGYAALTPLKLDCTDFQFQKRLGRFFKNE